MEAIAREIVMRKSYLPENELHTIYFGGGTPSMLDDGELDLLLSTIHEHFKVAADAEVTLEANPDDLSKTKLEQLAAGGINRLSIGIQSFHEPHLKLLNRAHSAIEAETCVRTAQDIGIDNISMDLIYAIPSDGNAILLNDLRKTFDLDVSHISAYCLTIEPQTAFGFWLKKKKIKPIDEEFAAGQFEILTRSLADHGYEQYEISNFARNSRYSRHNSAYWKQQPYLGVGPSAHSYNGTSREYNVSNNTKYLACIEQTIVPSTYELLSVEDRTNEYLLTGLRTKWGVKHEELDKISQGKFLSQHSHDLVLLSARGWIKLDHELILLTEAGKLFADRIASDLFID